MTEQIEPGTKVIVVQIILGRQEPQISVDTVESVATKSFTLTNSFHRYSLDLFHSPALSSIGIYERVVLLASEEGQKLVREENRRRQIRKAQNKCQRWIQSGTEEDRLAAIAGLQSLEEKTDA
jgi:hypothetical protein